MLVVSQPAFDEGFLGAAHRWFFQFKRAPDENLSLLHREGGQLLQHFGKTHAGKLAHPAPLFNPDIRQKLALTLIRQCIKCLVH